MTEFELSLAAALRIEAEEIAMQTDEQQAAEELHARFDQADRANRRRHLWYAAGTMAVAALVVVAAVVFSRQASRTDGVGPTTPDTPTSGATTAATFLRPPAELVLPAWTLPLSGDQQGPSVIYAEQSCAGLGGFMPCPDDGDLKLRLLTLRYFFRVGDPSMVVHPSYSDYVAALDALEPSGVATISDRSTRTVGGRPATVMSLAVQLDAPGAISCPTAASAPHDCPPLVAGRAARIAVVDQTSVHLPPTVFYISLNGDAPDRADRFAEFDTMLDSVSFN